MEYDGMSLCFFLSQIVGNEMESHLSSYVTKSLLFHFFLH